MIDMARVRCGICKKVLPSSNKLVEHIKRDHSKLSERSIAYLRSVGVGDEKIKKLIGDKKYHGRGGVQQTLL